MKLLKKWLFPALTCLIVAGAAVLPPQISHARDARQFGQPHAEELAVDTLPAYEPPDLVDRLLLCSRRNYAEHPVLSFDDYFYFEDFPQAKAELMQSVEDILTEAGLIPEWVFREEPFTALDASRLLLLDPAKDSPIQETITFHILSWANYDKTHNKHLTVYLDAESGLPIYLSIFDTNISQWLPYERESLQALAGRFFDLLGMDAQELGTGDNEAWHAFVYVLTGTEVRYNVTRTPTAVTIEVDQNWCRMGASDSMDR